MTQILIPINAGRPHWLLVCLLLLNAFATESLPLLLHEIIANQTATVAVCTVLVLALGEILPMALCSR